MAEFLGLGLSHYPGFLYPDHRMSGRIKSILTSKNVPAEMRDPARWPEPMQHEWSDDEGLAFAGEHRAGFVAAARKLRSALDAFRPDAVLIFGDDQYENFKEDVIPPFCVFIRDEFHTQPFAHGRFGFPEPNVWGEADDTLVVTPGAPAVARALATNLTNAGLPIPYSYSGHHLSGLGHAFINTVLYLDYDRTGWTYPIVPIHVNAYGSSIVRSRGSAANAFSEKGEQPDPPAPTPSATFDLGRSIVAALRDTPWRIAIVGSSSWSHAFLTEKHSFLYPDVEADRRRFAQMNDGDYDALRGATGSELESCGQHEFLNWFPLFGAMAELGRKPQWSTLLESYVMNSSKAMVVYPES